METHEKNEIGKSSLERVIGIIFLIPPVLGVIFFVLSVFFYRIGDLPQLENLSSNWTGNYSRDGGGFMSSAPIYLGLMAIAGALLLKEKDKKQQ